MNKFLLLILAFACLKISAQCPPPVNFGFTNTDFVSTTLFWTFPDQVQIVDILPLPAGSPFPDASTPGFTTTEVTPFSVTNLEPGNCYDFYIRSHCQGMLTPYFFFGTTCTLSPSICGGVFTDNGGPNGNYLPNTDSVTTICPDEPGVAVTVTFFTFEVESGWDGLLVYSGTNAGSNQIPSDNAPSGNGPIGSYAGAFWGNTIPGPFTSTSPDGCLTFRFISDNANNHSGWTAGVNCEAPVSVLNLQAFLDTNANGIQDTGEPLFPHGQFTATPSGNDATSEIYYGNGQVWIIGESGLTYDATFTINPEQATYFTATPTSVTDILLNGYTSVAFPVVASAPFANVSATLTANTPPIAGFSQWITARISNTGNTAVSGTATFTADPMATTATTFPQATITASGFTYDYSLNPLETIEILVSLTVPSIPEVSIGQNLTHSISLSSTDDELSDNAHSVTQAVIASYDPNDITEAHGSQIDVDDFSTEDYLYYTIRFQNTGTWYAQDVRLENTLNDQINPETFRVVASSHPYTAIRNQDQLTFRFDDINLPWANQDEETSNGYVVYKVKLNAGFAAGDVVPNTAEIYFDSNPAIVTNTFQTQFVSELNVSESLSSEVRLYPNPATHSVQVEMSSYNTLRALVLRDSFGRTVLETKPVGQTQTQLQLSGFATGMYILEVVSESGVSIQKKLILK